MKNEIKKIIIEVDENNLNKLVVIKNNTVEFYNANNLSKDELLSIYSYNVRELKKKYNQNIEGLSPQESINKLSKLGVIEQAKKELITSIQIDNQDTNSEIMTIQYENRIEKIKVSDYQDRKEYEVLKEKKILELSECYNLSYNEIIKIGLIKVENKIEKVLKENKIKNFVIHNKRLISSILIGAITVTGIGIGISKFKRKDNLGLEVKSTKEFVNTIEPNSSIVPKATKEVTVTPTIKITSTPYISATPRPTIVNEVDTDNRIPKMDVITPDIVRDIKEIEFINKLEIDNLELINNKIVAKKISDNKIYIKNNDIESSLNSLNEIREYNMKSIASNEVDTNDLVYVFYENFIDGDLINKAFIKYFSDIGNKIIESAYSNNLEEVEKYAEMSNEKYIRLIRKHEALEVFINGEKKEIYYANLANDTKEIVLNIIWHNNQCLNKGNEFFVSNNLVVSRYFGTDFYVFADSSDYKKVGYKGVQPHNACLRYSRAWASSYLSGTTNFDASGLNYYGVATENKQTALKVIMSEILEGRPVVIRVNGEQAFFKGKKKSSRRHFVTVCGIRKNVDINNLKESDFLIYDPTHSKRFKILGSHVSGSSNDRKLLKTEQNPGWRGSNYSDGYYLEVYNDSSDYLELDDVYEGKI